MPTEGLNVVHAYEAAALGLRFFIATVFVSAALPKLSHPDEFLLAVENYRLLPQPLARLAGRLLPWLEVAAGLFLLVGLIEQEIGFFSSTLLTVFAIAAAVNLLRGRAIDCGCGGLSAPRQIRWRFVMRNLVLAAMAAVVGVVVPASLALDSLWGAHGGVPSNEAVALLVTGTLAALVEGLFSASLRATAATSRLPTLSIRP